MSIDPSKSYWYSQNREQRGPVSGSELLHLAQSGQLRPTDLYWCEGMTDWLPISASGALPTAVTAPMAGAPTPTASAPAAASFETSMSTRPPFPRAPLRSVSFGMFLGLAISTFVTVIAGAAVTGIAASAENQVLIGVGTLILFVALGLGIGTIVVGSICIYRAWAAIQGLPGVSSTPGMAVGLMFVPLFNLYWGFIALGKWAKDYNRFVRTHDLAAAPLASEGLFITYPILAICGIVPAVGTLTVLPQMIVGIICMAQLCKAANFLKTQSEQVS